MAPPRLEFWFEFASTYSYLSALRLPMLAAQVGAEVTWRPFLLGPIFKAQGWETSPFKMYPAKGSYMWRDVARRAHALGLRFTRPDPFPQNGLMAARVATSALPGKAGIAFCHNIYLAEFAEGMDISDEAVVAACAKAAGLPDEILQTAQSDPVKHALRQTTEDAARHGLFGAPSFRVGGELFWGDDRLEEAVAWAQGATAETGHAP